MAQVGVVSGWKSLSRYKLTRFSYSLEAIRKAKIRFDRRGVVGHRFEKGPWLKAGKIECDDGMRHGRPPNLEISLITEIARMAGISWINEGSTAKSIDPVVG